MGDRPAEQKTGSTTTKHPSIDNAGPIIESSHESEEYQQDLQVVLGTAFGVIAVVGLISLTFLLYRIYKSRRAALSYGHNEIFDSLERDVAVEVDGKCQPVVLLLYSNDCALHERVVVSLAEFLMEACGVTVALDLFEENEITERGVDDWLIDRLQEADYIMVLCSLGARLRCSKKNVKFKPDSRHILPDYFSVAVDYVAEKMRAERQKGLSMHKFVTTYVEYSTRSDIPPQLETASQFCLMKDIHKLHIHLNTQGPDTDKSETISQSSTCENHYHETETGAVLKATIEQAKAFFRENPSWMDDQLESGGNPGFSLRRAKNRKRRRNSMEQPLLTLMGTPPVLHQCQHPDNSFNNKTNVVTCPDQLKPVHISIQHLSQAAQDPDRGLCNTLPRTNATSYVLEAGRRNLSNNVGIFQSRQNSLPSSLASSCVGVQPDLHALSKSMDSFALDNIEHPDGLPCIYCNCPHMDARPECRQLQHYHGKKFTGKFTSTELSHQESLASLHGGVFPVKSPTTILHAEVHQEWGNSNKGTPEKKCATFSGDPRSWSSDLDITAPMAPFQSLPLHLSPTNLHCKDNLLEWGSPDGMQRWKTGQEINGFRKSHRTLSEVSVSTDDSGSTSDGDSLERDLQSINKISSFQEFVNSSSFIGAGQTMHSLNTFNIEMACIIKPRDRLASRTSQHTGESLECGQDFMV